MHAQQFWFANDEQERSPTTLPVGVKETIMYNKQSCRTKNRVEQTIIEQHTGAIDINVHHTNIEYKLNQEKLSSGAVDR